MAVNFLNNPLEEFIDPAKLNDALKADVRVGLDSVGLMVELVAISRARMLSGNFNDLNSHSAIVRDIFKKYAVAPPTKIETSDNKWSKMTPDEIESEFNNLQTRARLADAAKLQDDEIQQKKRLAHITKE